METLAWIIGATLAGGVLSLLLAAAVSLTLLISWVDRMVSYAAGALLGVAFLDLLPGALMQTRFAHLKAGTVSHAGDAKVVFGVMLAGVLSFFLLEKAALWRHTHGNGAHARKKPSGMLIVVGDGFHNFVDGVAIAAAFLVDIRLGIGTTLAIIVHEIPQELGDFMILLDAGYSRGRAFIYNLLSSLTSIAGGAAGYFLLGHVQAALPYVLAISAASFVYIAIADLIPSLHHTTDGPGKTWQVALLAAGVATIAVPHFLHHPH